MIAMRYVYSALNNAFFPLPLLDDYKAAGWDVSDAIEIEPAVYDEFTEIHKDKQRVAGDDGLPAWELLPRNLFYNY